MDYLKARYTIWTMGTCYSRSAKQTTYFMFTDDIILIISMGGNLAYN